jgi:hypothetical protein
MNVNSGGATVTLANGAGQLCVGCTSSTLGGVASVVFASSVSQVWIIKDINSGNAPFSEVEQSYLVPEPMTLSLMGIGLLGLGIFGRKRISK